MESIGDLSIVLNSRTRAPRTPSLGRRLSLALALFLTLAWASAQTSAFPAGARFDAPVTFSTGASGESLAVMLEALARSVGLTPVIADVPDKVIVVDIDDPKPFRQLWDLVLELNNLAFQLQENDVVVIGTPDSLERLRLATAAEPAAVQREQRFYRVTREAESIASLLRKAVPGATVEASSEHGFLWVLANPEQHTAIFEALTLLDEVEPVVQRTYFLSNANAELLAPTLQSGAEALTSERALTVTADARTNSLVITGSAAQHARVADLIATLDAAQPLVNVKVRIQEITKRSAADLGIDWSSGIGNFTTNILNTGLRFVFDTTQVISSLNVLAVLDVLETQGLSRRVEDANLTILNNQEGTLFVGGTFNIVVAAGTEGERVVTVPYGVNLALNPRVTNDGRIAIGVRTSVDDLINTANFNIGKRSLETTVIVEPGETLVLGGLLSNTFDVTERRVPVLGSLPLIGALFTHSETRSNDTDLLVVVQADVIR